MSTSEALYIRYDSTFRLPNGGDGYGIAIVLVVVSIHFFIYLLRARSTLKKVTLEKMSALEHKFSNLSNRFSSRVVSHLKLLEPSNGVTQSQWRFAAYRISLFIALSPAALDMHAYLQENSRLNKNVSGQLLEIANAHSSHSLAHWRSIALLGYLRHLARQLQYRKEKYIKSYGKLSNKSFCVSTPRKHKAPHFHTMIVCHIAPVSIHGAQ